MHIFCSSVHRVGMFFSPYTSCARYNPLFLVEAATKAMVKHGVKGKLVLCSSILGYFSLVGYSTYSPGKFAIRGKYS